MPGCNFLSQPSMSNAGGVGMHIHSELIYTVWDDLTLSNDEFETLWIEIQNDAQHNILCAVIYWHPFGNLENFISYLDSSIENIHQESKYCIILGDFNLDLLKLESHPVTDNFLNILGTYFFQPYILQPTRITDHSETLIGNLFFNSIKHFTIGGNVAYEHTDHLPNFLIIKEFLSVPNSIKIYRGDYSNFDESCLINGTKSVDWLEAFSENTNPSDMFDTFCKKTTEIIDIHVPIKQLSKCQIKIQSKPWITPAIKSSIKEKNRLYKKILKTKCTYFYSKFKIYRNKLTHLLKISKRKHYNDYFCKNTSNVKKVWTGIKQIISTKPQTNNLPTKIIKGETELSEPKLIANAFNECFANIGTHLASTILSVERSLEYLNLHVTESFYLCPMTAFEICRFQN